MTITEYIVATILVGLISWAVLGLLMQECGRDDFKFFASLSRNLVAKPN